MERKKKIYASDWSWQTRLGLFRGEWDGLTWLMIFNHYGDSTRLGLLRASCRPLVGRQS